LKEKGEIIGSVMAGWAVVDFEHDTTKSKLVYKYYSAGRLKVVMVVLASREVK
jgi:hypothetical protein